MKALLLVFIIFSLKGAVAQSAGPKVPLKEVKAASVINESISLDTSAIPGPDQLLHLPAALTVASCEVGIASKGYVIKFYYEKQLQDSYPNRHWIY